MAAKTTQGRCSRPGKEKINYAVVVILDAIEYSGKYEGLGPRIAAALRYLRETDFSDFAAGEYEIDGRDLFAIVADYKLKPLEDGRLEAHRRYVDVQFMARGGESIGFVSRGEQPVISEYDEERDFALYGGPSSLFRLKARMFAIFFPQDLHMPGIGDPVEGVRKVVVKVRV